MRIRCLDRRLLRNLLEAFQHGLQQRARRLDIALHRVQRNLRLRIALHMRLHIAQVLLQCGDAFVIGAYVGGGGSDNATDLRRYHAFGLGVLVAQTLHLRMVGPEAGQQRLQLCGELALLGAKLHDRGRDRSLCGGARATARGIQSRLGDREIVAGARHAFGEVADLFGIEAGAHALHQPLPGAIGGDAILARLHLGAEFLHPVFQPVVGAVHSAKLHAQLVLDVGVHRDVDRSGGQHGALRGERDLQDARGFQRTDGERVLHRVQRGIAARIQRGARGHGGIGLLGASSGHDQADQPLHRTQGAVRPGHRPQGPVEFGIAVQVEPSGDAFHNRQAAQDLGLRRHHRIGDRIGAQDALHLTHIVFGGVVKQGAGRGVKWRNLADRYVAEQRRQ